MTNKMKMRETKMKIKYIVTALTVGITMSGPSMPFEFVNKGTKAENSPRARVNIYDTIGSNLWEDGVTAKEFVTQLGNIDDAADIDLHISTDGGDTKEGTVMYNALINRSGKTHVVVDGYAMSMGSVLAMAGKNSGGTTSMAKNALMFLHKPIGGMRGNAAEMREMADILDRVENSLVQPYVDASGKTEDEVKTMLADNTWLDAQQALEHGLIDNIVDETMEIAACFDKDKISDYGDVPESFINQFVAEAESEEEPEGEEPDEETTDEETSETETETSETETSDEPEEGDIDPVAAERLRCSSIQKMCSENGFSKKAAHFIDKGFSLEDASSFIMELKASIDEEIVNRQDGGTPPASASAQGDWSNIYKNVVR